MGWAGGAPGRRTTMNVILIRFSDPYLTWRPLPRREVILSQFLSE
jgi:hypothetical protein